MFKGFFNRMYNGNPNRPDIDPEDMPKNKFELFFTTLGLRFGDLIKLNLIFVVTILPILLWTGMSFLVLNQQISDIYAQNLESDLSAVTPVLLQNLSVFLLVLIPLLALAGPPLAGLTYVTRNYARDEHSWLWSDFKEHMKKNWKQSAAVMLLLGVIVYLAFVALQFYEVAKADQPWMEIMELIFIVFFALFLTSYIYTFPMMVTYKLKFGQLLKNSLMLALGRLPFTVIFSVMALFPVALGLGLSLVTPYAVLGLALYYLLLGFSLTAFILNSYTNATFDKLMKPESAPDPEDAVK